MIKLKTQLTATVSQKELEIMIVDIINKQLGTSSHITEENFVWSEKNVTITGTQQKFGEVLCGAPTSTTSSEIPFEVTDAVVKQPVVTFQEEKMKEPVTVLDSPFTAIVKDNVFTKVAAAKEAIGISTESSFPSVTPPNKFQLQ